MAALDVRAIAPDELLDWVGVAHVAFHSNRPPADEAAFRREAFDQDFARTLAAVDGERIVGTLESFAAELTLPGGTCVTADAITAVSVLPTHHRRGALTRMISSDLRAARERGEVASILVPSEYPIYGRFGFGPATRRVEYSLNPAAARFTRAAAGQVDLVEPSRLLELAPPIFDRVRRQGPGQIDRKPVIWEMRLGLRETPWYQRDSLVRCATYTGTSGEIEGYLFYRSEEARQHHRPGNTLEIGELMALTTDAYLGLWRFCCEIDLVSEVKAPMRPPDEPLAWLIDNPRAALHETRRTDFLWLRPLDMPRFFGTRRYAVEERLVIEVADPQELCGGRFVLEGGPSGASCRATLEAADLQLGMTALGALSLGGQNVHVLAEAGLIDEARPGALDRAERLFHWPVTPWCSTMF